jgi:CO/xanthine dehydrogenase Mo-binding subunit
MPNLGNHAGMHRNLDPIYTFRNKRLVKNLCADILHRTSAMRCLGAAANVFALECFMDELAQSAKADPITFRKPHLTDPRDLAVLDELEQQLATTPKHGGRGIAYARYKNRMTRVGIGLDIDVNDQAEVALRHAVIVAESGRVIDKEGLTAQLEGGFIQAASWALYEQVRWSREGITSRDWESYPVIRFDNIPDIKVTILDQPNEKSLGAGEATPGPTLAAIGNAIFDAIGIRMRRMPFTPDAIQRCAYKE